MSRAGRAGRVVAVLLAAVLALTGCGALRAITDLTARLRDAGFDGATVNVESTNGFVAVQVSWDADAETVEGLADESFGIATVVWREAMFRFDAVNTYPDAESNGVIPDRHGYERDELERRLGPRPAPLDEKSVTELMDVRSLLIGAGIAAAAALLLVVLVVVLVLRARRKQRAALAAAPPGAWAGGPTPDDPWRAPYG